MRDIYKIGLIVFIEGFAAILLEILSAKILGIFFGTSFKVWTAIISLTILFMAIGYFIGGLISKRTNNLKPVIVFILLILGVYLAIYPTFGQYILSSNLGENYMNELLLSITKLNLLPFVCFGMITPLIIQMYSYLNENRSDMIGYFFALSTLGGLLSTLTTGLLLLPAFGITKPILFVSIILSALAPLISRSKLIYIFVGLVVLLVYNSNLQLSKLTTQSRFSSILKIEEGLMGQLKITEGRYPNSDTSYRFLFINGIPQTIIVNDSNATSYWNYVHRISSVASLKNGKEALLFGLGGGSIAKELKEIGYSTDIVDIDPRMWDIAQEFFYYKPEKAKFIQDDARHFLNKNTKKYDLVIFDIASGEVQPSNVYTEEGFNKLKNSLKKDAFVVFQYQELDDNTSISASESIIRTLEKNGFITYKYVEEGDINNINILASLSGINIEDLNFVSLSKNVERQSWIQDYKNNSFERVRADKSRSVVLSDSKPILEFLNEKTILKWRSETNKYYLLEQIEKNEKLFN